MNFGGDVVDSPVVEVGAGDRVVRVNLMPSRHCQRKDPKTRDEKEPNKTQKRKRVVPSRVLWDMTFLFAIWAGGGGGETGHGYDGDDIMMIMASCAVDYDITMMTLVTARIDDDGDDTTMMT